MLSMAEQLSGIAALKTLEEEIIEQLQIAEKPLTCNMLFRRIPNALDTRTLSIEVLRLVKHGRIVRVGMVDSPPGVARQHVAIYALPSASFQQSQDESEPDMKNITVNPKKNTVLAARDALSKAICGIDRAHAITRDELIGRADTDLERVTLKNAVKRMCSEATVLGAFGATAARRYFDIRTLNAVCANSQTGIDTALPASSTPKTTTAATPAAEANQKAPAIAAQPTNAGQIEFSVYSDGRLAIIDGDEILVLHPEDTRRLGCFLGCFERLAWPPRLESKSLDSASAIL